MKHCGRLAMMVYVRISVLLAASAFILFFLRFVREVLGHYLHYCIRNLLYILFYFC